VPAGAESVRPTIVLVHGAFADSSSWSGVIKLLTSDGYPVVAAANPLRSVRADADAVAGLLKTIRGPVVLVGHSYGGMVISNAAGADGNVKALVYVDGFAPDNGESAAQLDAKFPGAAINDALLPAPLPGGADLYIRADKYREVFAADVGEADAAMMEETQRPVTQAAFTEASGQPAWKSIPSWFIYGDADLCIPPAAHAFMADRARAREVVVVKGGSHATLVSHPDAVAKVIEAAALQ
jgi:pimeloyl-ACP methyl ester carboxylesterase